jgi:hypothetical protein
MALTKSQEFGCVFAAELKTSTTKATAKSAVLESKHSLRESQTSHSQGSSTSQTLRRSKTFLELRVGQKFLDRRRLCKRFVKTARLRSVQERETFVRNA